MVRIDFHINLREARNCAIPTSRALVSSHSCRDAKELKTFTITKCICEGKVYIYAAGLSPQHCKEAILKTLARIFLEPYEIGKSEATPH